MKYNVEVPSVSCVVAQSNLTEIIWEVESENSALLLQIDYLVLVLLLTKCEKTLDNSSQKRLLNLCFYRAEEEEKKQFFLKLHFV